MARPARTKRKPRKTSANVAGNVAKGKVWTFPKNTLEEAIRLAQAIEEKNGGNPFPARELAKAVGFNQPDWRFLDLLRSANLYGLVSGTGASAQISLQKLGQDIVAPSSPSQRAEALWGAFRHVKEFDAVEKHYGDKPIPEDEFFLNTLTREFEIPRDRVEKFSEVFVKNRMFLKPFTSRAKIVERSGSDRIEDSSVGESSGAPRERQREFLDTCFVMMPFGPWPDRYYKDIYIPAVKNAGFEPVRADELFHTGSVVEQIWEQIEKARVLVADLSGKNPNVFYELGLAHAAKKPVVFTANNVDDVPFDLRHLRVIIYDIRVPNWGELLKSAVADYVRNAAKAPEKSIPHPFRHMQEGQRVSIAAE
jgi:hypothetical protein